jgi:DNA-binding response OmpR family regulator
VWVLIVEDEKRMGDLLRQGLEEANYTVTLMRDGLDGAHAAETCAVDAMVLDINLPGLDGFEVTRRVRSAGCQVPILMLTARDAPADVVQGLDAGADDYLIKPFPFKVLLARLRALTRRAMHALVPSLRVGDLALDPTAHRVTRADQDVNLTATEFRLLEFLMRRADRACSRAAIVDSIWGLDKDVQPNTVDVFIRQLRAKVDGGPRQPLIHTVRGYGYILREQS